MNNVGNAFINKAIAAGTFDKLQVKFNPINTDQLRVAEVLSMMKTLEIVPEVKRKSKDSKESLNLRNEANRKFVTCKMNVEKLVQAWELYSKSIAAAPNESLELSLAYGNRSALLMQLRKYDECIEDINRALTLNYPNHLKGKLLNRKIKCLNLLNNGTDINDTIEEMRCWLKNVQLSDSEKEKMQRDFNKAIESNSKTSVTKRHETVDFPKFTAHNEVPFASEALSLKYNEKLGRHLMSNRKINPGEILMMERPYAKLLNQENAYVRCSHCLSAHWAMIPCEFCVNVMYCSEKCKNEARKQYHDVECIVSDCLIDLEYRKRNLLGMRLMILSLREAGSVDQLRKDIERINNCQDPCKKGFTEDGLFYSNKYYSVYSLATNAEKRSKMDLLERTIYASFILYYLCTTTTLFNKKFNPDIDEIIKNTDLTFIGGLILHYTQTVSINAHSFDEMQKSESVSVGTSILPFRSLANHSCNPNTSICTASECCIMYASVPIEKGSQILDNYGVSYSHMDKSERQTQLSEQFYFECKCKACTENWPKYQSLLSYNVLLNEKAIKLKVKKELEKFVVYTFCEAEDPIQTKLHVLKDLIRMISTLNDYIPLPCGEFFDILQTYERVFSLIYGNKFTFPRLSTE